MDVPTPGIYPDVHFGEYCRWNAMNGSTLGWGWLSMQHLKTVMDGGLRKDSKDLRFGRALHVALLEPDKFDAIPVSPPCSARITSKTGRFGQICGNQSSKFNGEQWRCGVHGKDPAYSDVMDYITVPERDNILGAVRSVKDHKVVRIMRASGGVEKSFVWQDRGELMKGRVDKDIPSHDKIRPTIVDVKKVRLGRGTDWAFSKAVDDYHYAMKAAIYIDGLFANDEIYREFIWLVVEDSYPWAVNVIQADLRTIRTGRDQYQYLLGRLQECRATGHWPGYSDRVHYGGLTAAAAKRWQQRLEGS